MAGPWDRYKAPDQAAPASGPWSKFASVDPAEAAEVAKAREYDRPYEAAGKSAANSFTLGYIPEIEAASEKLGNKLGDLYYGVDSDEAQKYGLAAPTYDESLKANREEQKNLQKYNPISSALGGVGGAIAQAPLMSAGLAKAGIGAGGGLLARIGKSAATGAGVGALSNPGEIEAGSDQVNARLNQALTGGLLGAGGEAVGSAVGKGVGALSKLPEKIESYAAGKAIKSSGAMLKDFRRLMGKNRADEVGKFAIDKGYVKPGASFESIAEQTSQALDDVGTKIGEIYKKTQSTAIDSKELTKDLGAVVAKQAPRVGRDAYMGKMNATVEEIVGNPLVQSGDVSELNEVIKSLDDRIDWQKKAADLPENQAGFLALRRSLRDKVNDIVEKTGNKELKDLNKTYQNTKELNNISKDRVARESANRMFSLGDRVLGGAALAGTLASGEASPENYAKSLGVGLLAAGAGKFGRQYGNPILTQGLLSAGRGLKNINANVAGILPESVTAQSVKGLLSDPRYQILNSINAGRAK